MLHKQKSYTSPILQKFTLLKSYQWKLFSHICNNLSQQKYINGPVFNHVSRRNHYSRMKNTLETKIKPFPHNLIKVQKHPWNKNNYFLSWSSIIIKLDKYLYK